MILKISSVRQTQLNLKTFKLILILINIMDKHFKLSELLFEKIVKGLYLKK